MSAAEKLWQLHYGKVMFHCDHVLKKITRQDSFTVVFINIIKTILTVVAQLN